MEAEVISSSQIDYPRWNRAGRVHDWRNYVTERVRAMWGSFTREQREAIAEMADEIANGEEWE